MSVEYFFEKGLSHLMNLDPNAGSIVENLKPIHPPLVERLVGQLYGDVYQRKEMPLNTRLLVTVACVAAMGDAEAQLKFQGGLALKHGVTRQEIEEVLLQVAFFCGYTRAINAALAIFGES